jgi:ankyrin repeat protein
LQEAVYHGFESTVQLLLENGADINAQGGRYGNALEAAVVVDRLDIAQLLLSRGAKVDPPGAQWEELLTHIVESAWGTYGADRLRKFQENPSGFLADARDSR